MGKKTKTKQPEQPQPSASANGKAKGLPPTPPPDEDEVTKQLGINEPEKPVKNKAKGGKKSGSKQKKKSAGIFSRIYAAITLKRMFIAYIVYVVLVCSEKSDDELADSLFDQRVCTNALSRYILKHDLFSRYVEPSFLFVKVSYNEHARPHVDQALVQYDRHVKPHVHKAVDTVKVYAEPHIETANAYAQEYYRSGKGYYDENVREHVDKYYSQASEVATPYVVMARDHASVAYEKAQENYEKRFLPWYKGNFLPWTHRMWVKAVLYFESDVVPAVEKAWEKTKEAFDEHVVPRYKKHVHPYYEKYVLVHYRKHVEPHYKRHVHPYVVKLVSWVHLQIVGKEELDRRAREAHEKERAERKRKEAEAARVATEGFVNKLDAAIKQFDKTVKKTVDAFDVDIRKPTKTALDTVNSEIDKLKASIKDEVDKIKVVVDEVTADSQKTSAEKKAVLTQSSKESLDRVTEAARIARLGISGTSTLVDKIKSLKQSADADVTKALKAVQKTLTESTGQYPKADKSALRKFLTMIDEIRTSAKKSIEMFYSGDMADLTNAVSVQHDNVKYLSGEAEKKIQNPVNEAIASFVEDETVGKDEKVEKKDEAPVEQVVIAVDEGKKSEEVPASTTSDPVLELLTKRFTEVNDPVLKKLTAGYERYKEGLPPTEESEPEDEEGEGEGYEGDEAEDDFEQCDKPGEC